MPAELTIYARDIMSRPVISITGDTTVREAAHIMLEKGIGALVVVNPDGTYAGLFDEKQLLPEQTAYPFLRGTILRLFGRAMSDMEEIEEAIRATRDRPVAEVMRADSPTAKPDTHLAGLANLLLREEVKHVPILDGKIAVGIVSQHDVLRALSPD